ncbi:lasso RiPP family leader peptide-containing protein [Streptomyces sp. NPDC051217]|nr:lasso RiPP family leader peptide-containing protein [Streptomyces sp. NBC_01716]
MADHDEYETPALVELGDFAELTLGWDSACEDIFGGGAWAC